MDDLNVAFSKVDRIVGTSKPLLDLLCSPFDLFSGLLEKRVTVVSLVKSLFELIYYLHYSLLFLL